MKKSTPVPTVSTYEEAYPNSTKVYDEQVVQTPAGETTLRVPFREVSLGGGEPSIRLYDTSGPQGHDPRAGLPKLREGWVAPRRAAAKAGQPVTQLHYARKGQITPEMAYIASREGLPADFVRDEVARGRA
ncbi:MAG: phosphomethylpyrimidine synthase ThiC, partial [Reyranella sp.]|nr:phosphomethylpyrimidine synthase ThiC [Reyranella sp.]